jgi:tetratricopeptide (TPR) repeat protein
MIHNTADDPGQNAFGDADALVQAGLAASQAGDTEKAVDLFARAAGAAPGSAMPHFLLGSEYAASGDIANAETSLANAVLLAPGLHIARYQLGLLQFSSGRAAAALVTWGPLFALEETGGLVHFVRGFGALAQDDLEDAQRHFDAGLSRNTENPALSGDIQKVLAGIRELQATQASSGPTPSITGDEPQPANHVLVSNYGKVPTLH